MLGRALKGLLALGRPTSVPPDTGWIAQFYLEDVLRYLLQISSHAFESHRRNMELTRAIRISNIVSNKHRLGRPFTCLRNTCKDLAQLLDTIFDIDRLATKDVDDRQPRSSVPASSTPNLRG